VAVLLNAEWDHPDVFADETAVLDAFEGWISRAASDGRRPILVANVGDAGVRRLVARLAQWPGEILTVGINADGGIAAGAAADISARHRLAADGTSILDVQRRDKTPLSLRLGLVGRHNAANAMAVIGAATVLGVSDAALTESLATFAGVGRRLELKGEVRGVAILDDYGHHPTAIARTLEAVRGRYPGRRTWAVYEPLTYHRTAQMLDGFADVLAAADVVAIVDIWAGRDPDRTVTSSDALAAAVGRRGGAPAEATGSPEETAVYLADRVAPGDVVLVMGGGRSYVIADRLVALLGGSEPAVG
jgi:UDP-N-acetylmuramate--alanine ligase